MKTDGELCRFVREPYRKSSDIAMPYVFRLRSRGDSLGVPNPRKGYEVVREILERNEVDTADSIVGKQVTSNENFRLAEIPDKRTTVSSIEPGKLRRGYVSKFSTNEHPKLHLLHAMDTCSR